jgi:sugar lactone lactonase YvrE
MKRARTEACAVATVSVFSGSREGENGFADGAAADARFRSPAGVAIDAEGNLILADSDNHCIRKVTPDGTVSTLAGSREGENGFADGAAADARFYWPEGVAIDAEGNIIVADRNNYCIRKVTPDGTVSTLAGSREGENGFADGAAADARFNWPEGVAIDAEGNIIVADSNNHCIRKVTPDGTVSTLAGSREGENGFADGAAADARFNWPAGVAIDAEGNIIVADSGNDCIRKVTPDGTVSTLAGSREGEDGFADGAAADARFRGPEGVAIDAEGNIIVADSGNHCIRKVTPDGTVSTLAGSREGEDGFADGAAADARFDGPYSVAIDADGSVLVADNENHCIRKLTNCGLTGRWCPTIGPPTVLEDMLHMLADDAFADVTFEVEGARITAHRAVLVSRSAYFRGMFMSPCRETRPGAVIVVHGTTSAAFRSLLAYLYSDSLELDDDVVIDVMQKAREYQLTRAFNMCVRYCRLHVQSTTVVPWLVTADTARLDELREAMLQHLRRHFRSIRAEAPEALAALVRASPDLVLEVMNRLSDRL